jgi:hypothetical protein
MHKSRKTPEATNAAHELLQMKVHLDEIHPRVDALEADMAVLKNSFNEQLTRLEQSTKDKTRHLETTLTERMRKLDERIEYWGEALQPQVDEIRAELPVLQNMFMRQIHALEAENEQRKKMQQEYTKFLGQM